MYDPTSRYLHVPESRRSFGSPRRHQDRSLIWSASLTTPDPSHVGDPDVESQSRSVLSQSSTVASYACKCKLYIAELQVRFECSAVSRPLICSLACTDQAAGPGSERSPGRKKFRIGRRHEQSKLVPNPIFVFPWVWWQPANGYGHIYPAIFTHYRCSQSIACLLIR
jgi:hypothetical protein